MKQSEALVLVQRLAAAFSHRALSKETIEVYVEFLQDLPEALAQQAVTDLIATAQFLPVIAEIRRRAAVLYLGAPGPHEAFEQAVDPDKRGERHPLVAKARKLVGDPYDWRERSRFQLERAFLGAYEEVMEREVLRLVERGELAARVREIEPSDFKQLPAGEDE